MCDEPTGNLDTVTTLELTDLLESLHREGTTLLVITHNPAVAGRAQRQIAIRDGQLTEQPSPSVGPPPPAVQALPAKPPAAPPTEPLDGDTRAFPDS
jgi:putative ABC transport system ATP-binding protein